MQLGLGTGANTLPLLLIHPTLYLRLEFVCDFLSYPSVFFLPLFIGTVSTRGKKCQTFHQIVFF